MDTATVGERSDWARWANLILGSWLFISAFVWPHARDVQTNTWMVGMLIATFAVLASAVPALRLLNSLAAVWLLVTTPAMTHNMATIVNNALVGIAVLILSLVGGKSPRRIRPDYVDVW